MARPGLQPNAKIIGWLDLPFGETATVRDQLRFKT